MTSLVNALNATAKVEIFATTCDRRRAGRAGARGLKAALRALGQSGRRTKAEIPARRTEKVSMQNAHAPTGSGPRTRPTMVLKKTARRDHACGRNCAAGVVIGGEEERKIPCTLQKPPPPQAGRPATRKQNIAATCWVTPAGMGTASLSTSQTPIDTSAGISLICCPRSVVGGGSTRGVRGNDGMPPVPPAVVGLCQLRDSPNARVAGGSQACRFGPAKDDEDAERLAMVHARRARVETAAAGRTRPPAAAAGAAGAAVVEKLAGRAAPAHKAILR